jgi:prepilin-type processing-associated H-X9-DG protein
VLLVVLILPGLAASREAARRARCVDNLRQLGLAALSYADAHGCLPAGSFDTVIQPHNFSVFTRLLPQLGQVPIYNAINMSLSHVDAENITIGTIPLAVLVCPGDTAALEPAQAHYSGNPNSPASIPPSRWLQRFCSYAGNAGTWDLDINSLASDFTERKASMNGTIFGMSTVALADIGDGTGNTMLLGERAHGILDVPTIASKLATWTGPAVAEYHFWQSGETVDALFETWGPPNQHKIGVGMPNSESLPYLAANASSFHPPGGAHFAFCDGSVRFLKESIDSWKLNHMNIPTSINYDDHAGTWSLRPGSRLGLYQALSTRNGGEVISAEEY